MIYIDRKYLLLISTKLEYFKQKDPNVYTFRCPFCGDSQKSKSKTRGFVYAKNDNYFFTCFNCSHGTNLISLIKYIEPSLAKEYIFENFNESIGKKTKTEAYDIIKNHNPPVFIKKPTLDIESIKSLDQQHFAKKYVLNRNIPTEKQNLLYFAENFSEYIKTISDKNIKDSKPRLIIPFFSKSGELIAIQGRAFDSYSIRYITIKIKPDTDKLYGLERVSVKKPIQVVEGPIDSLFLDNCIATADSNLASANKLFEKQNLILIPDNQPRNKEIVKNIEKYIDSGFKVCLFPNSIKQKDINEMIQHGYTKEQIQSIIDTNTFSGIRAKLEFINWKKI